MGISLKMQQQVMPEALRARYGDKIGNELCFLLRVVRKDDSAIEELLKTIDTLHNDDHKLRCINAVWDSYYRALGEHVITE